jgi:polar amino acid transport system permease protein
VSEVFAQIASGIGLTILITGLSLLLGAIIALPLVAARRSRFPVLRGTSGVYINVVRAIPPLTWLFLIYFGLPQLALRLTTFQAAILGFSVISSAYLAEAYRAGLLSISKGQWEASSALGLGFLDRTRYIITPQAFRVFLPIIAAFAIGLLKDSALASTIGLHEITYQATVAARQTHNGLLAFAIAGLLYIAISLPLALVTRRVDRNLRARIEVG